MGRESFFQCKIFIIAEWFNFLFILFVMIIISKFPSLFFFFFIVRVYIFMQTQIFFSVSCYFCILYKGYEISFIAGDIASSLLPLFVFRCSIRNNYKYLQFLFFTFRYVLLLDLSVCFILIVHSNNKKLSGILFFTWWISNLFFLSYSRVFSEFQGMDPHEGGCRFDSVFKSFFLFK